MKLESGPASGERNYWLFVSVLCLGFTGWFIYDGLVGWPAKNREKAEEFRIQQHIEQPFELGQEPTSEQVDAIAQAGATTADELHARFGEPARVIDRGAGRTEELHVSIWGAATFQLQNGKVEKAVWTPWAKTRADIQGQFWWAGIPLLIALYGLFKVYKAVSLRVTVDDEGMIYDGRRIPFSAMTDLRDYSKKGWVDLYYKDEDDDEVKLRLDNQKVDKFDEIIEILCAVKGFKNPLPAEGADEDEPAEEAAPDEPAPADDDVTGPDRAERT